MTTLEVVRHDRGLSKAEAARLVQILPEVYSLIERGLLRPTGSQIDRIESAFRHPIAHLLAAVPLPPPIETLE